MPALASNVDVKPADPREHTGFVLAQLGRAVTRRYRAAMEPIGLRPRGTATLLQLSRRGAMTQQDLGCALDIDPSNLVALLNDLERDQLITRARDECDRRRHVVAITARGMEIVDQVHRTAVDVEAKFFAALDDAERDQLLGLLKRVADTADVEPLEKLADEDGPGGEPGC